MSYSDLQGHVKFGSYRTPNIVHAT